MGNLYKKFAKRTQEQVSQLTGLETKYISQIECGIAKGTINTMLKFCEAYNVTPNDILYKFIQKSNAKKDSDEYEQKFMKLNKKDRKIIYTLIIFNVRSTHSCCFMPVPYFINNLFIKILEISEYSFAVISLSSTFISSISKVFFVSSESDLYTFNFISG